MMWNVHEENDNKPENWEEKAICRFHDGDTCSEDESEDEDSSEAGSSNDGQSLHSLLRDHKVGDVPI